MSPKRSGVAAFRAVGGDVVTRAGRVLAFPPLSLVGLLRETAVQTETCDGAAAGWCASMADELEAAITEACAWRRAAGATPPPAAQLSEADRLTGELKARSYR